jgi:hypothetical protein
VYIRNVNQFYYKYFYWHSYIFVSIHAVYAIMGAIVCFLI